MSDMPEAQLVMERIRVAFGGVEFPGAGFLQGSFEGDEPEAEVGPFRNQTDWQALEPDFLDIHAAALHFFSEAGLRFFLPAYLIADLKEQLNTADPVFSLTNGFFDLAVEIPVGARVFTIKSGKSTLINPRRYGAATFMDYARYRLSIFTREEVRAIVEYLQFKRDHDALGVDQPKIDAALTAFWNERAQTAPAAESLQRHLADERAYIEALQAGANSKLGEP